MHIASVIGRIESKRLAFNKDESTAGFTMLRPLPEIRSTWQLDAAEAFLMLVLFGTHRLYLGRLQQVRLGATVYLQDFRALLQRFLAEWSGPCSSTCRVFRQQLTFCGVIRLQSVGECSLFIYGSHLINIHKGNSLRGVSSVSLRQDPQHSHNIQSEYSIPISLGTHHLTRSCSRLIPESIRAELD